MQTSLITIAYIAASALFILSLGGLSQQETARRGNLYGIIGMLIALIATAAGLQLGGLPVLIGALIPGLVMGWGSRIVEAIDHHVQHLANNGDRERHGQRRQDAVPCEPGTHAPRQRQQQYDQDSDRFHHRVIFLLQLLRP